MSCCKSTPEQLRRATKFFRFITPATAILNFAIMVLLMCAIDVERLTSPKVHINVLILSCDVIGIVILIFACGFRSAKVSLAFVVYMSLMTPLTYVFLISKVKLHIVVLTAAIGLHGVTSALWFHYRDPDQNQTAKNHFLV